MTCQFLWTIDNFSGQNQTKSFAVGVGPSRTTWVLGVKTSTKNNQSCYCFTISSYPYEILAPSMPAGFTLSILDSREGELHTFSYTNWLNSVSTSKWNGELGSLPVDWFKEKYLRDGKSLSLLCKAIIIPNEVLALREVKPEILSGVQALSDSFRGLFLKGLHSDFLVKTEDGKEFVVHKCVLASRSKYFAAMLEKDNIRETKEGFVKIEGFSAEVVLAMLKFIYSGKIDVGMDAQSVKELLIIADKYQMDDLKEVCDCRLSELLTSENVCDMFVTAETFGAKKLKLRVIDFISKNSEAVKKKG